MSVKIKPTCGDCGDKHWNFVACTDAAEANEAEARAAKARAEQDAAAASRLGHVNQFAGARSAKHNVTYVPGQPLLLTRKQPGPWRTG